MSKKTPDQIEELFGKILFHIKAQFSTYVSGTIECFSEMTTYDIMDLYDSEYIRRETPLELAMESQQNPANPGLYIWCRRDYTGIHWRYIVNRDVKVIK